MVMWKSIDGISTEEAQKAISRLNDFLIEQPGFRGRQTAIAEDGTFLDIVYWKDLQSAKVASEKALKTEELVPIFGTINQNEMTFKHFEIFNELKK